MAAPSTSIDRHPDLVEMRNQYDRAASTPTAQIVEGLTFLTGLYLAISPWVVGFAALSPALAVSNLIVGLAFAALAVGFSSAYGRTHPLAWTAPLLGVWVIISQWVIARAPDQASIVVNNIIAGGLAVLCGLAIMGMAAKGKKSRH